VKTKTLLFILTIVFNNIFAFTQNDTINSKVPYKDIQPFEDMPGLVGGYDLLLSKIKYPEEAIKNNIEGKVIVKVSIDTTGKPIQIKMEKGMDLAVTKQ